MFYIKKKDYIICKACNHFCKLKENERGKCKVRVNIASKLKRIDNHLVALAIDPIEKKPLYHYFPFSSVLSYALSGCNFSCAFCQNYAISKELNYDLSYDLDPEDLVNIAVEKNIKFIAATYTEPTVFIEYALDVMKYARKEKIKNIFVSNGYFSYFTYTKIKKYLDAINVDLKGDIDFYKKYVDPDVKLDFIITNIKNIYNDNIHVEITNLVLPKLNENIDFIYRTISNVSHKIPLHISAFYPTYKMQNHNATNYSLLKELKSKNINLDFVYLGNVFTDNNTYCPKCGNLLIDRNNKKIFIEKNTCPVCGYKIYGNFN